MRVYTVDVRRPYNDGRGIGQRVQEGNKINNKANNSFLPPLLICLF